VKEWMMQYVKYLGFLQLDLHIITKFNEEPHSWLSNELKMDIVTVLAKHDIVTDHLIIDFLESEKCEQKDILHKALIDAGKRIGKENLLSEQKSKRRLNDEYKTVTDEGLQDDNNKKP
jgi:hypothetical protein